MLKRDIVLSEGTYPKVLLKEFFFQNFHCQLWRYIITLLLVTLKVGQLSIKLQSPRSLYLHLRMILEKYWRSHFWAKDMNHLLLTGWCLLLNHFWILDSLKDSNDNLSPIIWLYCGILCTKIWTNGTLML